MDEAGRWQTLVRGLVGDEHLREYTTSASFKASIDLLARMLPVWVEGLASRAEREDAAIQGVIEAQRTMPPFRQVPIPDMPLSNLLRP